MSAPAPAPPAPALDDLPLPPQSLQDQLSTDPPVIATPPHRALSVRVSKKAALINGMAFTVGWANVLCLLQYESFGTMMTGNTMFLAQNLVLGHWVSVGFYASLIASFCIGQSIFRAIDLRLPAGRAATFVAPLALLLAVLQDVLALMHPSTARWHLALLSCILGMVCGLANEIDGVVVNMVTGHIQKIANMLFDFVTSTHLDATRSAALKTSSAVLASFFAGVCGGTLAVEGRAYASSQVFVPMFTPLGLAFAGLLCLHDHHVRERLHQSCLVSAPLDVSFQFVRSLMNVAEKLRKYSFAFADRRHSTVSHSPSMAASEQCVMHICECANHEQTQQPCHDIVWPPASSHSASVTSADLPVRALPPD